MIGSSVTQSADWLSHPLAGKSLCLFLPTPTPAPRAPSIHPKIGGVGWTSQGCNGILGKGQLPVSHIIRP